MRKFSTPVQKVFSLFQNASIKTFLRLSWKNSLSSNVLCIHIIKSEKAPRIPEMMINLNITDIKLPQHKLHIYKRMCKKTQTSTTGTLMNNIRSKNSSAELSTF